MTRTEGSRRLPLADAVRFWRLRAGRIRRRYAMHVRKHLRPDGVLPDFLIIGAMKSGTTTLFAMLEQHPGFLPPAVKEIQYFTVPRNLAAGPAWYRAHFPSERTMRQAQARLGYRPVTGEATPAMSAPMYAREAAELVPDARIIVSLRNPVDRAWSHYQHYQRHPAPDPRDFETAVEQELAWLASGSRLTEENFPELAPIAHRLGYVYRGQYAEQLESWFACFDRSRFLILNFDQWKMDPVTAANRVTEFVGLPPNEFRPTRSNQGHYRTGMPEHCRMLLTDHFRPWNRRLFELIGEDWQWPS